MQKQEPEKTKTSWHRLLGRLLEELLTPTGITVLTDVPVMSEPPEADILMLRREKYRTWTKEQKLRLPDGIRDSLAKHILLEFKYSESINKRVFRQTLCYDYLYPSGQKMEDNEVQTFIISSKTPRESTLREFAYFPAEKSGVYHSKNTFLENIPLILLNELSNEPHNAWIKCFASKGKEKKSAFNTLNRISFSFFTSDLKQMIEGLYCYWSKIGGQIMSTELTPEKIMEYGRQFQNIVLAGLKPDEIMAKFSIEDRLKGLKPKDRLEGLKPKDRLEGLKPKDRLEGLTAEEIKELDKYLKEMMKKKSI